MIKVIGLLAAIIGPVGSLIVWFVRLKAIKHTQRLRSRREEVAQLEEENRRLDALIQGSYPGFDLLNEQSRKLVRERYRRRMTK